MKNRIKNLIWWIFCFVFAVVFAFLFTTYVIQRADVDGESMENTLQNGDILLVDRLTYQFKDPERFDIIICTCDSIPSLTLVKRVIGLPGETVQIDEDGIIYINGEVLDENYGKEVIANPGAAAETITLGDDEYFVLGDNRNNSSDSRDELIGNIHKSNILGKVFVRLYPNMKLF